MYTTTSETKRLTNFSANQCSLIYGDNGVVALHITNEKNSTDSMYYVHSDHLGSFCAITNANKQIRQRNCFDPWGNMPKVFPLSYHKGATQPQEEAYSGEDSISMSEVATLNFFLTKRGFTGHEHYPYFKIINMNGRLYDPVIARFFSPDNFVQIPEFSQSFNRYSYCLNNPLMYVDPSGELIWKPDSKGNLIMEEGDDEISLAKFLKTTKEAATQLLMVLGYTNDGKFSMNTGDVLKLDNVFTRNLAAHGDLPFGHDDLCYNCWGAALAGVNEIEIKKGVGIDEPYTFDNRLQKTKIYSNISLENAVFGKTVLRFTTDNPYSDKHDWDAIRGTFSKDPDARGGALHGAVYYGTSKDGTVYVYTKNGWKDAPRIMRLSDVESIYGHVRGLNGQSGYYLKLH